jgi:TonB family protein
MQYSVMCVRSRIFAGAAAAATAVLFSIPVAAQQSELEPLARKVAGKLKTGPCRIIVAGFLDAQGSRSPLGMQLAGEFSEALHRVAPGLEVVSNEEIRRVRGEELWSERNVRKSSAARDLAVQLGARLLITGSYERRIQIKSLRVRLQAFDFRKNRDVATAGATLPFTAERARLREQVLPPPQGENDPSPQNLAADSPAPLFQAGKDGVGIPECRRCPLPSFTREARKQKYTGHVVLRLIVTLKGRATNIRVEQSAKYGLTEAAVKAVQQWRFKPAKNKDGIPVSAETTVEIAFRMM